MTGFLVLALIGILHNNQPIEAGTITDRLDQPQLVGEGRGVPGRRTGGGTRWEGGRAS